MENRMYRVINNIGGPGYDKRESYADYLEYHEALEDYKRVISGRTSIERAASYDIEPYYVISEESESNPAGEWHWCQMRTSDEDFWNVRVEPIQAHEAQYFASEDVKAKFDAIYGAGASNDSMGLFARLFRRKK